MKMCVCVCEGVILYGNDQQFLVGFIYMKKVAKKDNIFGSNISWHRRVYLTIVD